MGKLIHSKTFRSNLLKWLFTYIVVLLATTSVITYSKYISDMQGTGVARTAKFNVVIEKGDVCVADSTELCNLEKYKPYDDLDYYFTVDTSELEVTTLILTNIEYDSHYEFYKLYVSEDNGENYEEVNITTDPYSVVERKITVTETIEPNQGYTRIYKLRLDYDAANASQTAEYENAVVADYLATQLD